MSDEASVERQKRIYRTIKVIEENGGNTNATRAWWPLTNHSGGDQRFPTCGARHSILRKFGDRRGQEILQEDDVRSSRARWASPNSTPVKVERAKLRRPSSWSSMEAVTPIKRPAETEVVDLTGSFNGNDSGMGPSPVKVDRVLSSRKDSVEPEPSKFRRKDSVDPEPSKPRRKDSVELYPLDHIWDSEEEIVKAEEQMCGKCSRTVVWELMDSEDRLKKVVREETAKAVDEVTNHSCIAEARSQQFVSARVDEMANTLRNEQVQRDARLEAAVRRIVREELAGKYYTKKVRRSVEDMEAAVKSGTLTSTFKTPEEHESFFRAEEARVKYEMRKSAESMERLKAANRRIRARRSQEEASNSETNTNELAGNVAPGINNMALQAEDKPVETEPMEEAE